MDERDWRAELADAYGIDATGEAMLAEAERRGWTVSIPTLVDDDGRSTCRLMIDGTREVVGHGMAAEEALADAMLAARFGEGRV